MYDIIKVTKVPNINLFGNDDIEYEYFIESFQNGGAVWLI